MQFKSIIVLALAAAVSAVPTGDLEVRTTPAATNCPIGQASSCCNQLQKVNVLGLLPVQIGVLCTLNVLSTVCNNQAACCQTNGATSQTGLVNVNGVYICNNVSA